MTPPCTLLTAPCTATLHPTNPILSSHASSLHPHTTVCLSLSAPLYCRQGKQGARGTSAAGGRGGAAAGNIQVVTAALSGEVLEMQPLLGSTANGHHEGSRAGPGAGAGGGVGSGASSSPPKASALGARHNGTGPGAAGAGKGHSKAVGRGTHEEEELVLLLGDTADEETPARGQGLPQ